MGAAAAAKSLQSCPTLCDPMDGSPPGFPIPGILQARMLDWVAISFSSAWKWKGKVKPLSRVRLFATPWTVAYQAPPSMRFSSVPAKCLCCSLCFVPNVKVLVVFCPVPLNMRGAEWPWANASSFTGRWIIAAVNFNLRQTFTHPSRCSIRPARPVEASDARAEEMEAKCLSHCSLPVTREEEWWWVSRDHTHGATPLERAVKNSLLTGLGHCLWTSVTSKPTP